MIFNQSIKIILLPLIILFLGSLIYVLFRSADIFFIEWLLKQNNCRAILEIRSISLRFSGSFPNWFLYSLPDALWLLSFAILMLNIWKNESYISTFIWAILVPLLAIIWEFAQFFNLLIGTFDWMDVCLYLVVECFTFFKLKTIYNEKTF